MKTFVFLLNLIACTMFCYSQTDTIYNQIDEQGLKQGCWKRSMNEDGKTYLYAIERYKDGLKDGLSVYFYPNGKTQSESYFENDALNGLTRVYRPYGIIQYEENFKNGKSHGFKKYYNSKGELSEEQEYSDGTQTGFYHLYSKSERIVVESFYINGVENGTRKVYSDDNRHEIVREFDFKNDIKIAARYYKRGRIIKEEKYNYDEKLKKNEELKKKNQTIDG